MAIHGCHSCGVDLSQYESYEESPCASCKLMKEHYRTPKTALFDSGDEDSFAIEYDDKEIDEREEMAKHDLPIDINLYDNAGDPNTATAKLPSLKLLKEVIENQVFIIASSLVLKLTKWSKDNPVMFEVVIKKMQFPYMSYADIGDSMDPPCGKQNVLYHLKHAVSQFPELNSALLTDTRFSGGRYALQTVANKNRQVASKKYLQRTIYGDDPAMRAKAMSEITAILRAPFMTADEVLNFNPYIENEREDDDEQIACDN